jgi:crotonobetaine/carnitine-CoA ligase
MKVKMNRSNTGAGLGDDARSAQARSATANLVLRPRTLLEMVRENAASPSSAALRFVGRAEDGALVEECLRYDQLLDRARLVAGALQAAGMRSGDRFALLMRNRQAFVEAMVASEIAETEFVSIDPRIRGEKLAKMIRFAGCKGAIVCPEGWSSLATAWTPDLGLDWIWTADPIGDERTRSLDHVATAAQPIDGRPADFSRTMQLLYTSSTTGDAKAIVVTHGRFATAVANTTEFGLQSSDIIYSGLSLTHANAQFISLGAAIALNADFVISRRFSKSRLWEDLTRYGCTVFNLLGGMTSEIYAEPPSPFDRAHQVRQVISAGMPGTLWPRFEERFGVRVFEFYGTAEGGLLFNPPGTGPVGSIGKPPPGMVCALLDDTDRPVGANERGQICFRNADGSVAPVQYLANSAASASKTRDGWFRSGDYGTRDGDGWYYFSHRAGRSVRRNGDFVDTAAVETWLAEQPEVSDVYVFGIRTDQTTVGERRVVAAVVPESDQCDAHALFGRCVAELGKLGAPDFIQTVAAIPKTASEKPQERELVALINAEAARVIGAEGAVSIHAIEGMDDAG